MSKLLYIYRHDNVLISGFKKIRNHRNNSVMIIISISSRIINIIETGQYIGLDGDG